MIRQAGWNEGIASSRSRNAWPEVNVSDFIARERKSRLTDWQTDSSSSTIAITALRGSIHFLCGWNTFSNPATSVHESRSQTQTGILDFGPMEVKTYSRERAGEPNDGFGEFSVSEGIVEKS